MSLQPLTPCAPVGADRLIGNYCSISELEEGRRFPHHHHQLHPHDFLLIFTQPFLCFYVFISFNLPSWLLLCAGLTSSLPPHCLPSFLSHFSSSPRMSFSLFLPFYLPDCNCLFICPSLPGVTQATWQVTFFALPSVALISNFTLSTLSSFLWCSFPSLSLSLCLSVSPPSFIRESISFRSSLHPKVLREPARGDFMVKDMLGVQS